MEVKTIPPHRDYSQMAVSKCSLFHIKNIPLYFLKSKMAGAVKKG